uniref:PAP-associated domain-containing protein n=1 Tax=Panagrolaimus superbus TaxID=310955 RepID=A0A914ZBX7_9BILA
MIFIAAISEFFRQKFKVDKKFIYYCTLKLKNISNLLIYGRGFGIDDINCRQSAVRSFFEHLHEVQLVPDEFLNVLQEECLETNVELKAACINRWNLFTELVKQPQCQLIPSKPFNEKVTDLEKKHVISFWDAFKQNLNCFSRKRKLTVFPVIESDGKKAKIMNSKDITVIVVDDVEIVEETPSPVKPVEVSQIILEETPSPVKSIEIKPIIVEESPSPIKPIQNGRNKDDSDSDDASAIDLSTVSGDIDLNSVEIPTTDLDDEGDLAPPEEEMTATEVHAVDAAIENEEVVNFGAYPDYQFNQVKNHIKKLKNNASDIYEKTNKAILSHYNINLQDEHTLRWKEGARQNLETACQSVFPSARLYAVGSSMNGCGAFNSDMDICVVIREEELNPMLEGKSRAVNALQRLKKIFLRLPMTKRTILIKAVVPILQITFKGSHNELEADININNTAGIYNTHLIHHYSRQDDRFPALCLLIKHWALNSGINSAQEGTFNSYSLILLVLHYMQCACQPPIMPNLQEVCPNIFNAQVPITDLRFFEDEYTFESDNHSDFTALLMGFFAYYAGFDFDKYAISIRRNRVFPKQILPQETRKKYVIFIEEPFDHNNTARCVRPEGLERIKLALGEGNRIWNRGKRPSLKKIGVHLPKKYQ